MSETGFRVLNPAGTAKPSPTAIEEAYRRGYREGYLAACDTMHGLMFKERKARLVAFDEAWAFANDDLLEWMDHQLDTTVVPPDLPARWK